MTRIVALIIFCLQVALAIAQTGNADLSLNKTTHDFGTVDEAAGKVTCTFTAKNTGREPIVILSVKTGCRCVSANAPTSPIAPGKTANISVTFDPAGRSGTFHKELTIISQDKKINRIHVRGNVRPAANEKKNAYRIDLGHGLMANVASVNFGTLAVGASKTMELRFMNDFPVGMNLTFELDGTPNDFSVDIPSSFILRPDAEGHLPITLTVTSPFNGPRTINLIPVVNNYRLTPIPLTLRSRP